MILHSLTLLAALLGADPAAAASPERFADAAVRAAAIDELAARHWQAEKIEPADLANDADFLRRVTLDLIGRIPTAVESRSFAADAAAHKRSQAIRRLLLSPEFGQHWSAVLDDMIQGRFAGDREFQNYLRAALADGKSWDKLFAELIAGPWTAKEQQPALAFLRKRIQSIDDLTNDTSRVFFGVEIGCAKCHDHPLVEDWKQRHYYGLQSFFNRTQELKGKEKQDKQIGEKDSGDVTFVDTSGKQHTAQRMFLSGEIVADVKLDLDPRYQDRRKAAEKSGEIVPPSFSPRAELVDVALRQKQFFSRALVNRVWAYLLGRGLVHPVEQMHSANPPSVPGLLEFLADDFASHGYQIDRVVAGIVNTRVYQLSSTWPSASNLPAAKDFARAPLRPLSPQQFAVSLLVATGEPVLDDSSDLAQLTKRREELDGRARGMTSLLDARRDDFQTSAGEALFMSNNPAVQQLMVASGKNLAARLTLLSTDNAALMDGVAWSLLSRAAEPDEAELLSVWMNERSADRGVAIRDLVWALMTSAEFRFNH